MFRLYAAAFILASLLTTTVQSQSRSNKLPYKSPKPNEYSPNFFTSFEKEISIKIPSIGSFLIWRHDKLIYEKYFHGGTNSTLFNIKSITKSVISGIGGIAKDKGLLPDLNTPVLNILTEYAPQSAYPPNVWFLSSRLRDDSIRKTMTLKNLLTMQTGFEWNDFGQLVDAFIASSEPIKFMLDLSFESAPGQNFNYCSGAASIFGAVLTKVIKTDLKEFANANLFHPIGATLEQWDTDPTGRYLGASEMYLTAQDLVRFGLIYLNKGKVDNKRIISESWIKESLAGHATLNKWPVLPNANGYGYFWWRRKTNGHQAYIASGAGGQIICIIPDLDMVIATTCFLNENNRGRIEIKNLHSYIDKVVKETKTRY